MRAGAKVASRAEYTMLESIQNAYQGFAKQNYTMLDNLKLGYGGTKKEMERLLADAEKISGVKYDMSNLGDVYAAIHVIQGELGLTGVAAQEGAETFTGSMAAMKAAAQNLLANLSLGEDITEPLKVLVGNTKAFLINNMLPMIGNIVKQIPTLLGETAGIGRELFTNIAKGIKENAPKMVETAKELILQLIDGFSENTSTLLSGGMEIINALWQAMSQVDWIAFGRDIITSLKKGIQQAASTMFGDGATLDSVLADINAKLPEILDKGIEIVTWLVNGIMDAIPKVLDVGGKIITSIIGAIIEAIPTLFEKGADLIHNIIEGITSGLPEIGTKAGEIIGTIVRKLIDNLPQILETGVTLIGELAAGIVKAIPAILETVWNLGVAIWEKLKDVDWKTVGQDIMAGIAQGLVNFLGKVVQAAKDVGKKILDAFKDFFGIHSPSTVMVNLAHDLIQGLINGIKDMVSKAAASIVDIGKAIINAFKPSEWIEKGKELGGKLAEGIGNAKDNVVSKIGDIASAAINKLNETDFGKAGLGIGNAIANGISSSKSNALNQMSDLVNGLKAKVKEAENAANGANLSFLSARLSGSVGTAELYGSAGDEALSTESEVLHLLEKYLPMITINTGNSQYDAINRQMGWQVTG